MPFVGAAVVPHSPVIVPTIAGQHEKALRQTREALSAVAEELYARQVDVLIILTPHGPQVSTVPTLGAAPEFTGSLIEFGDRTSDFTIPGSPSTVQHLKQVAEDHGLHLALSSDHHLDYGSTVPLVFLRKLMPRVATVPVTVSASSWNNIPSLSTTLQTFAHDTKLRLAVLASADLARRQKPQTKLLPTERTLGTAIGHVDPSPLMNMSPDQTICGVAPIFALLQTLHRQVHHGRVLSFEAPLGVGLMTALIESPS